tara:strand:+ start:176 stop:454 length:279 start_codon:yes stop_codon:yes gene_type:complete
MRKFDVSDSIEHLLGAVATLETMREVPETYNHVEFIKLALMSAKTHDLLCSMVRSGQTWVTDEEEEYLVAYGDDLVNILEEWARTEIEEKGL